MSQPDDVARSAFRVTAGSLLSLVVRLAVQVVIASIFGATAAMDAFFSAMVVPAYVEAVLLSGLAFVFIPAFVKEEESDQHDEAWALAGTFFWLTGGVLTVVGILGALGASRIIGVTAPGLEPAKSELASQMLAVLMLSVPIYGVGSLTKGIQHARRRFFGPALAHGLGSLGNVLVVILLRPSMGPLALAWGYLFHAVIVSSVTVIPVVRHGWSRVMPLRDKRVLEMGRLIVPFILFGLLTRSTGIVERFFASGLPDGQLSCLGYAHRLAGVVFTLLGVGLATAIFPTMAREYVQSGKDALVRRAEYGIQLTLAIALPAIAVLSVLAIPLITVLLERGAFDRTTTVNVARILPAVMIGSVFFAMMGNVLGRTFYVIKDTVTAPAIAFVMSAAYIVLAKWFVTRWGFVGLAWAEPVKAAATGVVLAIMLYRRLPYFDIGMIFVSSVKYVVSAMVAALVALGTSWCANLLPVFPQLMLSLMVAGVFYILLLMWLDRAMANSILELTGLRSLYARVVLSGWRYATAKGDRLSSQPGDT